MLRLVDGRWLVIKFVNAGFDSQKGKWNIVCSYHCRFVAMVAELLHHGFLRTRIQIINLDGILTLSDSV